MISKYLMYSKIRLRSEICQKTTPRPVRCMQLHGRPRRGYVKGGAVLPQTLEQAHVVDYLLLICCVMSSYKPLIVLRNM